MQRETRPGYGRCQVNHGHGQRHGHAACHMTVHVPVHVAPWHLSLNSDVTSTLLEAVIDDCGYALRIRGVDDDQ